MSKTPVNPALRALRKNPHLAVLLAKHCGISRSAVCLWRGQGVPARHALKVAEFLNLSPHDVRPDLYPKNLIAAAE